MASNCSSRGTRGSWRLPFMVSVIIRDSFLRNARDEHRSHHLLRLGTHCLGCKSRRLYFAGRMCRQAATALPLARRGPCCATKRFCEMTLVRETDLHRDLGDVERAPEKPRLRTLDARVEKPSIRRYAR